MTLRDSGVVGTPLHNQFRTTDIRSVTWVTQKFHVGSTITNGDVQDKEIDDFRIFRSTVENGDIQVEDVTGFVRVRRNTVSNGNIQIKLSDNVRASRNRVLNGNIQVEENFGIPTQLRTGVNENIVTNGNIQVHNNENARVRNNTASGDIQCVGNGILTSSGNVAGGVVECP